MDIQLINQPDGFGFFFVNVKFAVDKIVAIRGKATVPFAFTGFLNASFHSLNADVFTFDFSHSGQDGNHQLASILGAVDAIFYADQIHTEVLHHLKCRKHVSRIAPEPGQLKHQHIRHMILAAFDVIHHAAELSTSFNGLARFSGILIFADNFIVVELSVGFHPVF